MESWKSDMRFRWLAAGGLALAAGWAFYAQSIAPLRQREMEARPTIATLKMQIADARCSVSEVRGLEAQVNRERGELNALQSELPEGSAMIWLPELVKGHFAQLGIAVTVIRLNTALEQPGLPGYQRAYWSVALAVGDAPQSFKALFRAVADLEQENASIRVLDFAVRQDPENPAGRVASLNVAALIRK